MIQVALCDDQPRWTQILEEKIKYYAKKNYLDINVSSFSEGESLLQSDIESYDVLFLDVDMAGVDGIEVARKIRQRNNVLLLVYVSGLIQYAPMGYAVKAFDYILKNDLDERFEPIMNQILKELNLKNQTFKVKLESQEIEIPTENILYIESFKKIIVIHTYRWKEPQYEVKIPLRDAANELELKGFLQVHKSYIVNMQHISKLKKYLITLKNGQMLKGSERNWQSITKAYVDWKGRS